MSGCWGKSPLLRGIRGGEFEQMIERRKFLRLKEPLIIRYYVIGGGTEAPYQLREAEVVDSSKGGVRFKTDNALEEGALVEMEMMLPLRAGAESYKRAVVMGKVVRLWEVAAEEIPEYGVEFVHVDVDMQEEIEKFIANRLASGAEIAGEA